MVENAIAKADVLIEAMSWIRAFRDKVTVIKLGGSLLADEDALRHILIDVVFMETVGMRPVIVHGGGKAISAALEADGIQPQFVQGRRVTDGRTLEIVKRVLVDEINNHLAEEIERLGGRAMTLNYSGTNVLFGDKLTLPGSSEDLGFVGDVHRVDRAVIENLCYAGQVPVIPSLCEDDQGQHLNVNADTAAMAVAKAINAHKLVFLSDVNGVRRDKDDPDSIEHTLTASQAAQLVNDGNVGLGMIPKVQACIDTLQAGVHKIHIIDGRLRHSLLLEVYTNQGVGTQIIRD